MNIKVKDYNNFMRLFEEIYNSNYSLFNSVRTNNIFLYNIESLFDLSLFDELKFNRLIDNLTIDYANDMHIFFFDEQYSKKMGVQSNTNIIDNKILKIFVTSNDFSMIDYFLIIVVDMLSKQRFNRHQIIVSLSCTTERQKKLDNIYFLYGITDTMKVPLFANIAKSITSVYTTIYKMIVYKNLYKLYQTNFNYCENGITNKRIYLFDMANIMVDIMKKMRYNNPHL